MSCMQAMQHNHGIMIPMLQCNIHCVYVKATVYPHSE